MNFFLKSFFVFFYFIIFLILFSKNTFSDTNKFIISVRSTYNINEEGTAFVKNDIKIENKTEYEYAPSLIIKFLDLSNVRNVTGQSKLGKVVVTAKNEEDAVTIKSVFDKKIVGVGKINEFTFSYESYEIAKNEGGIWEINVPAISKSNEFSNYAVEINVPEGFGKLSISKPKKQPTSQTTYTFTKEEIKNSGINLIFGTSRFYNFDIDYYISNSNMFPVKSEIAIPASTNYQDVLINKIFPIPEKVYQDFDGNSLAVFSLSSGENKKIKVSGIVKVNSHPKKEDLTELKRNTYLDNKKFWEKDDIEIQNIALKLGKNPEKIYDFVINTLSYDYDKVSGKNERYGAKKSLLIPGKAVCLEFTDLFIAISRAAGIPARSLEGYAYTQNSRLKPLSLIKDILHAWPEYYDDQKKTWIMVDPTWGNTTKGLDYFNILDLEHIVFVTKGKESSYPKTPGEYKEKKGDKNIKISFARASDFKKIENENVDIKMSSIYIPFISNKFSVIIFNKGNSVFDKKIEVISPSVKINSINSGDVFPYGNKAVEFEYLKFSFSTNNEYEAKILIDGKTYTKKIKKDFKYKNILLMSGGVFFGLLALVIAGKTRRIFIQR